MNDNLSNQLAALAAKFNVSVDVLYGALVKQALIDGIWTLVVYAVIGAVGLALFKRWKQIADLDEIIPWFAAAIWGIFFVIALFTVPNTIAAFLNTDYWVLHQIMGYKR